MQDKNSLIINICHGGLGNRLKPLSSCFALARYAKRELHIIWEVDKWCEAEFSDLFVNDLKKCTLNWVMEQENISFYANKNDVINFYHELIPVLEKFGCKEINAKRIINDSNQIILIINNDYMDGVNAADCKDFFDRLSPIPEILNRVKYVEQKIKLDQSFIGVHARGTDFETGGVTHETYLDRMKMEYIKNNSIKFFVCSDAEEYEVKIKNSLPNVFINKKENYVAKLNKQEKWANNISRSKKAVQDAVVDMYLLSKTDFKIYYPHSTFAHIVNLMSKGILERNIVEKKKSLYKRVTIKIRNIIINLLNKKNRIIHK